MEMAQFSDFRSYLRFELKRRIDKNPGLSLRGFAAQLGMSPSHLSRVLKGEKKISFEKACGISLRLRHSPDETAYFSDLVQLESENEKVRHSALERVAKRLGRKAVDRKETILPIEKFQVIAEWQHFAILSLTRVKGFSVDPKWISSRLGISQVEAKLAIERLKAVGMLELKGSKVFVNEPDIATTDDVSSAAIRSNHLQNIENAMEALNAQPVSVREFQNSPIAFKQADLARAKARIREFLGSFIQEFEADEADGVYQLNLQFFPLYAKQTMRKSHEVLS